MSDNNNSVDTNKDIEPVEDAVVEQETEVLSDETAQKKSSSGNGLVYILILLVIGASLAGAYYFWGVQNKYQSELAKQMQEMKGLKADLNNALKNSQKNTNENQQKLLTISQQMQSANDTLIETTKVSQQAIEIVNRSQRDWALAEVDYLLRIAHRRLEVARDISGSIAALKGADSRLKELADLKLFKIRKQIAKDIADLNSISTADVSGIALALDQLLVNLNVLPFKSIQEEVKTQLNEPVIQEIKKEQTFVDSVIKTVKEIGDIKIHQRSIKVATGEMQQSQIEQLLNVHLLGARLALLNKDQMHFEYEIEQSRKLVIEYYDQTDERVKRLLSDLSSYLSIELNPVLPVLSMAWSMLQSEVNKPVVEMTQETE